MTSIAEGGEVLAEHDLHVAHGQGGQQLQGPAAALLREQGVERGDREMSFDMLLEQAVERDYEQGTVRRRNKERALEAVRLALGEVKGAYALAVLWAKAPGVIVSAKTASPLIIGLGEGENFLASDVPAVMDYTRSVVFMEDGDLAALRRDRVDFYDLSGKRNFAYFLFNFPDFDHLFVHFFQKFRLYSVNVEFH